MESNWYGIEWDVAERGKHDGQGLFDPVYHAKGTVCCSFIKEGKLPSCITIEEALRIKYQTYEDMTDEERKKDLESESIELYASSKNGEGKKQI